MNYKRHFLALLAFIGCQSMFAQTALFGQDITWDKHSLMVNNKRVAAVMGEIHYSRVPADKWREEVHKMKEGGVTIIANYVFWNHVEEQEGIFDWSGQRSLRRFLEACKDEGMPVVVRIGPFCHGEARNGGIPDWVFSKGCKTRDLNPEFMGLVETLYRQIYTQVQGLQWKDGGPVIACQFDNEYGGMPDYLMALKKMANDIGFDLPFYTYTGWPGLKKPLPFGEMLPLYGDYADGFWDRELTEGAGTYYHAFNFNAFRKGTAIASEQLKGQKAGEAEEMQQYPYFTCELGGGMATSYHRRPYIYGKDALSMAIVKLGSGSNLLGYYMYHGGTNPDGKLTTLNETQCTPATNWNELPVKTYDFQAPIGEFGQLRPHYYLLRPLHLFMQDFGDILAPMEATFPAPNDIAKGEDKALRWSYRSKDNSGFVFINNYERFYNLTPKQGIQFDVCGVKFPRKPITIPSGAMCIFPVNVEGMRYATAQLVAQREGNIYLMQIPGIKTEIAIDGKVLNNLKPYNLDRPVYKNIYLLDQATAEHLFLKQNYTVLASDPVYYNKIREASSEPRNIMIGKAGVAVQPSDADYDRAAVYDIPLPEIRDHRILKINYVGDCARLYADGQLIDDNFYLGRTFEYALWSLPASVKKLQLKILPLQKDMPIYFPREADVKQTGERIISMTIDTETLK